MSSAVETATSKKIGSYDKWEVESAVSTMRRAAEIEKDPKFLAVVVKEMNKEADKLEDKADLLVVTAKKLDKVFGKKRNA